MPGTAVVQDAVAEEVVELAEALTVVVVGVDMLNVDGLVLK